MAISHAGLSSRGILNGHGENETIYLQDLHRFVRTGKTNADILIDKFNGEWGGDIMRAYEDCRY